MDASPETAPALPLSSNSDLPRPAQGTLAFQFYLRIIALEGFLEERVPLPADTLAPTSMEKARIWEVLALGIEPVGSKGSTNAAQTAEANLPYLAALKGLVDRVKALKKSKSTPKKKKATDDIISQLRAEAKIMGKRLNQSYAAYHAVVHDLDSERENHRAAMLKNNKLSDEIITLRRNANEKLRLVKGED
jgi:hypothetical protein